MSDLAKNIYQNLLKLGLSDPKIIKSISKEVVSKGKDLKNEDLRLQYLESSEQYIDIALHVTSLEFERGVIVCAPDMEVRIYKNGVAQALSIEDSQTGTYQYIDYESDESSDTLKNELNLNLNKRLVQFIDQGHQFSLT